MIVGKGLIIAAIRRALVISEKTFNDSRIFCVLAFYAISVSHVL